MKRIKLNDRVLPTYTKGEEIANMITHIVGGAIGIIALALCIIFASIKSNIYGIVSGGIFGVSMITLYTMSSIYHGLNKNLKAKKVFQTIDHCTIFFLIAGTYSPILLCTVRNYNEPLAWTIFCIIWFMAILGIALNSIDLKRYKTFSMICYLAMGWCIIITSSKLFSSLGLMGSWLLVGGGIFYTIGSVFYIFGNKVKYFHTVFHILVDLGSLCHFLCILLYVV